MRLHHDQCVILTWSFSDGANSGTAFVVSRGPRETHRETSHGYADHGWVTIVHSNYDAFVKEERDRWLGGGAS